MVFISLTHICTTRLQWANIMLCSFLVFKAWPIKIVHNIIRYESNNNPRINLVISMGFGVVPPGHVEWHHPMKNIIQIIIDHENNVQFIYNHIQLTYPSIFFRVGFNAAGYRLRVNDNVHGLATSTPHYRTITNHVHKSYGIVLHIVCKYQARCIIKTLFEMIAISFYNGPRN